MTGSGNDKWRTLSLFGHQSTVKNSPLFNFHRTFFHSKFAYKFIFGDNFFSPSTVDKFS